MKGLDVVIASSSLSCGEFCGAALRSGLFLGVMATFAGWLKRRSGSRLAAPLKVELRCPLNKEAGLALVRIDERRLLVGYGMHGVSLMVELGTGENNP